MSFSTVKKENLYLLTTEGIPVEKTVNLKKILWSRVLSKNGFRVGWVKSVQMNPDKVAVEGIVVSRGAFHKSLYIGKEYIDHLSDEAVILTIDPPMLLKGKKVVTYEGEVVGKVKEVMRKGTSSDVESILVHSFGRGSFTVPVNAVKSGGQSIILRQNYDVPKKHFFKRSG